MMTEEEYEARRAELTTQAEEAKKVLNKARSAYDGLCDQLHMLRIEWRDQQRENDRDGMVPFRVHKYAGHDTERAESGKPGHCDGCVKYGHVMNHPKLGCADVGCTSSHQRAEA